MSKDYYKILGVSETASDKDIKSSFRKLAKQYHPDRNKGDKKSEDKFKEISEAYDILSDSKKRSEYDNLRKYGAFAGAGQSGFSGNAQGAGFDPTSFEHIFRQGKGGGGNSRFEFRTSGGGFDQFEDILSQFFGGGFPGQKQQPRSQKGADLTSKIDVTFMEAAKGSERILSLSNGKKLKVKIPKGIEDGGKIRLAGQGQPGYNGGANGDLIITVKIMPDQTFDRKGNDIYTTVNVSFIEAIKGTKVKVNTLSKSIMLTIPPGTQPDTQLRLKGQGLSVGGSQGDQYVTVKVNIPKELTEKQKKLLDEWE